MASVMWFRRDLRLEDNTALAHAFKESEKLILIFQVNPEQFQGNDFNQRGFFLSLKEFSKEVNKIGHLQILYGETIESFKLLKKVVFDWKHVYFNRDETGFGFLRDKKARQFFADQNITVHTYDDHYLHGATEIKNQSNELYKVFTPYYKKWKQLFKKLPVKVDLIPEKIVTNSLFQESECIVTELLNELIDLPFYSPGERAGKKKLKEFITNNLHYYYLERDIPSIARTSRISTYLRTGEISIRTVWYELQQEDYSEGKEIFSKELCWRDFYNMVYFSNNEQKTKPIKSEFAYVDWDNDEEKFVKWKEGKTGFPIVDAGMRQLIATGWMHNRLRMITASFLTKDLLIDWRWGERYFQQMLIDYDPANNIGGWQWAASTGADPVPYFRIFNPTIQAKKFDPTGAFIRTYVKELRKVPAKFIHEPVKMKEWEQKEYAVVIGETYPLPIVNHNEARKKAISKYETSKVLNREINPENILNEY